MLRHIIEIDQASCNGCGDCVPTCHEGALQIIDNKAHLISDLMCDGLGACLGHCPTGALKVILREATPYDERQVMINIIKGGKNVIQAHLQHLQHLLEHNELKYHGIALQVLQEENIPVPLGNLKPKSKKTAACPGTESLSLTEKSVAEKSPAPSDATSSQLSNWPIQLHLINPTNSEFYNTDLLLAADCCAFSAADFHQRYLTGKKLAMACPKLDPNQESYIEKLSIMIRYGKLNSITVLRMDVPCCAGLSSLVDKAVLQAKRKIPIETITINKQGYPL
ncbi:MAG: NAD-dependent dihydropyrimidine dehydrogenase PreA subunit [Psychromonas sp.]|jgi:NAD-dependent dihydropyrimidine dehydrogenase PreA subunit|uniref:ATP-binding protein n=1 Tax=Psychromonas sp. TaxID=1884585 RepID=UPI0039E5175C